MSTATAGAVRSAFNDARSEGRSLLVGYLPGGFPSIEGCVEVATAMVEGGVDVVEIGLPYTDPVMDGPVIQKAVEVALQAGVRTTDVIATAGRVAKLGVPALVMTYWNPIERYGVTRFAHDLAQAGGTGVITPDLTPEESADWSAATRAEGIDTVFVAAPSSPDARLDRVAELSTGFVYAASVMGVTGTRTQVGTRAHELVDRLRGRTDVPIAVGLGVSTPAQAAEVAAYADGVIVGSAFVRALFAAPDHRSGLHAVKQLAQQLSDGVRAGRSA